MKLIRHNVRTGEETGQFRTRVEQGFTFMELMIVMVIIAILSAVAIPKYLAYLRRAKEVVLQQNLWTMRRAIDFYTTDKEKAPGSLQELVDAGYIREIPKDPMCPDDCQWLTEAPKTTSDDLNSSGGIGNVRSAAPGVDSNKKPYSEY